MNHPHPQRARNTSANEAEAHAKAVVDRVRKMTKPELVAYFASLDKEALDTLWARSGLPGGIVDPSARHKELANFAIMYRRAHLRKWAAGMAEAMLYGAGIALGTTAFAHRNRHVPPSVDMKESVKMFECGYAAAPTVSGEGLAMSEEQGMGMRMEMEMEEGDSKYASSSGKPTNDMRNGGVFEMAASVAALAALALHNESVQWRAFRTRYKHTVKALATAFSEKSSGAATTTKKKKKKKKNKKNKMPETKKTATHTRKSSSS
jgi:hypothetical protein